MASHVDILDQPEPLGRSLAGSLALHTSVAAVAVVFSLASGSAPNWGSATPGGGSSMIVNLTPQVPLPANSGAINPVASDTQSEVPEPKPDKVKKVEIKAPEPDAIEIPSRTAPKRPSPRASSINKYREQQIDRPNQLYNTDGQKMVSPLIGQPGAGGVGVGPGSPFGDRYGYYVDILRQMVAQKWRTGDVDPRIRTAPQAIVTFRISRAGAASGIRLAQSSGNTALDLSAQRAIADAAPFPHLPDGFDKNEVSIEFRFQLKR